MCWSLSHVVAKVKLSAVEREREKDGLMCGTRDRGDGLCWGDRLLFGGWVGVVCLRSLL